MSTVSRPALEAARPNPCELRRHCSNVSACREKGRHLCDGDGPRRHDRARGQARACRVPLEQRRRLGLRTKGLEWLGTNASVGKALSPRPRPDPDRLWGIAALGIPTSRTGEFVLDLERAAHPLVAAAWSGKPARFPAGRAPARNAARRARPIMPCPCAPISTCRRSACC